MRRQRRAPQYYDVVIITCPKCGREREYSIHVANKLKTDFCKLCKPHFQPTNPDDTRPRKQKAYKPTTIYLWMSIFGRIQGPYKTIKEAKDNEPEPNYFMVKWNLITNKDPTLQEFMNDHVRRYLYSQRIKGLEDQEEYTVHI